MQELKTLLEIEKEASKIVNNALKKKEKVKEEVELSIKEYESEKLKDAEAKIKKLNKNTEKELQKLTEDFEKELKELKKSLSKDIDKKVDNTVKKLLEVIVL